ncbi:hypothetical protein [Sinorhizobium fredii]|uniref:hypothetical protein n=1 Tax=Rhizobium fredii TaxID=380 RepID=UPI0004B2E2D9|nr:hypothetical protein [Sinorhizobium fredii]
MRKAKKNPSAAVPLKGRTIPGNAGRYIALLARELLAAVPNGGDYGSGAVAFDVSFIVDMDEVNNLANAVKGVVIHRVSREDRAA